MHSTGLITPVRNSERVASMSSTSDCVAAIHHLVANRVSFESLHFCGVTAVVAALASLIQPEFASSGFNKLLIASAYIAAPLRLGCPTAATRQRIRRSSRIIFSSGYSLVGLGKSW